MKGIGTRIKVDIQRTVSAEQIENALLSKDGMDLDEFLANKELTANFKRAGIYIISVNIPQYDNYIKICFFFILVARLLGKR